jgi:hypothetical protein
MLACARQTATQRRCELQIVCGRAPRVCAATTLACVRQMAARRRCALLSCAAAQLMCVWPRSSRPRGRWRRGGGVRCEHWRGRTARVCAADGGGAAVGAASICSAATLTCARQTAPRRRCALRIVCGRAACVCGRRRWAGGVRCDRLRPRRSCVRGKRRRCALCVCGRAARVCVAAQLVCARPHSSCVRGHAARVCVAARVCAAEAARRQCVLGSSAAATLACVRQMAAGRLCLLGSCALATLACAREMAAGRQCVLRSSAAAVVCAPPWAQDDPSEN